MDVGGVAVGYSERVEQRDGDGLRETLFVDGQPDGRSGRQQIPAVPRTSGDSAISDLLAELSAAREKADRHEAEAAQLRAELDALRLERDAARLDAEAHAETARVVSEVMEKVVEQLRGELDSLYGVKGATARSDLVAQRDELDARLAEIEGSRAWAAVKLYRGVRLRLPRPS